MLFNSYPFLLAFLPAVLLGYELAARISQRAVIVWLTLASMAFYAYWRPSFLILLLGSILFNYTVARLIARQGAAGTSRRLLVMGIAVNLVLLGYCKYFFPLLNWTAVLAHSSAHWDNVLLPLGISFFTFTQIAYLIDLQQGSATPQDFAGYCLFVTFFPHLIAGPILHHAEMMPQFQREKPQRLRASDVSIGFSWFVMGLFKKVMIADRFAIPANAAFRNPLHLNAVASWAGALSYALQLYFDFSGYSDMALGLARMFSIDFPLNFSSPYKAASIIDFWQRWHMTLTRYINVYLYNPSSLWINRRRIRKGLKISRKALATAPGFLDMVVIPTLLTLLLAGIWHGAGLQFVIFGLLHGVYLSINHAWLIFVKPRLPAFDGMFASRAHRAAGVLLTFSAVVVAQIFFRAANTSDAVAMLKNALGFNGLGHVAHTVAALAPASATAATVYTATVRDWLQIAAGFAIVWLFPNTQQLLLWFKPALEVTKADKENRLLPIYWRPTMAWAGVLALALFAAAVRLQDPSTFLYFQF